MDDTFNFQIGGGEYVKNVDGILTAYGRRAEAQFSASFASYGVVIALIIPAVIRPETRRTTSRVSQ